MRGAVLHPAGGAGGHLAASPARATSRPATRRGEEAGARSTATLCHAVAATGWGIRLITRPPSAGVAQAGGDAVDGEQQGAAQLGVHFAAPRRRAGGAAGRPAGRRSGPGRRRARPASASAPGWVSSSSRSPVTRSTSATVRSCSARIGVEDVLQLRSGTSELDVVRGDAEVGLGQRHLDVGHERPEEVPLGVHLVQHRRRARPPRAAASPEPTPNQPGTICRDWVQPKTHGIARSPASPAPVSGRRDGREPMLSPAELLHRRGRRGSTPAGPGRRPAPGTPRTPRRETTSIAASQRASALGRLPGLAVQHRRPQHRGQGQLQVLPGQRGQRVLVGDDLALLGELDLARRASRTAGPGSPRASARRRGRPCRRGRGRAAAARRARRRRRAAGAAPCGSPTARW